MVWRDGAAGASRATSTFRLCLSLVQLLFICLFIFSSALGLFGAQRAAAAAQQPWSGAGGGGGGRPHPGAPRSAFPMCGTRPRRAVLGFSPGEHYRDAGSCGVNGADPLVLFLSPFSLFPPAF